MKCHFCNQEQNDANRYCEKCGANLTVTQQSNTTPPPPPPPPPAQNPFAPPPPPPPPYGQNPYNHYAPPAAIDPEVKKAKNLALGSLIAGLAGIIFVWCCGPVSGIIAMVLGFISYGKLKKLNQPTGMAVAGIVLGAAFFFLWFICLVFMIITGQFAELLSEFL